MKTLLMIPIILYTNKKLLQKKKTVANEQEVKGLQLEEREAEKKKAAFVMGFEKWVGLGKEEWRLSRNQSVVQSQLWGWDEEETWD